MIFTFIKRIKRKIELNRIINIYSKRVYSLTKHQSSTGELLQLCHRLEKGLVISNPKLGWGEEKAKRIIELVSSLPFDLPNRDFYVNTALGVLSSYSLSKKQNNDNSLFINELADFLNRFDSVDGRCGGIISIKRDDVLLNSDERRIVEKAIISRHSTRRFSSEHIDISSLYSAISLANHCPSACNRQPFHVYIMSMEDRRRADDSFVIEADKYLIVTGRIDSFSVDEYNDWIVSSSIYAGYLSFCLHVYGIANCPIRMDLLERAPVYSRIRKTCGIPDSEQIVLEFAVGNYDMNNVFPLSHRFPANGLCTDCSNLRGN